MQTTLSTATVTRNQAQIRFAALIIAFFVVAASLALLGAQVRPGLSAASVATNTNAISAAANGARLLKLDNGLFSAVNTPHTTAATSRLSALNQALYPVNVPAHVAVRNQRLLDVNNQYYPSDNFAVVAAARSQHLFDLNDRFYPAEVNPSSVAAQVSARLLELNSRFYPQEPAATESAETSSVRWLEVKHVMFRATSFEMSSRSPRDARLLELNR